MSDRDFIEKCHMSQIVLHNKEQTVLSCGMVFNYGEDGRVKSMYTHDDCEFIKTYMQKLKSIAELGIHIGVKSEGTSN